MATRVKTYKEPLTAAQTIAAISEETGLSKRDVKAVLESMKGIMHGHIRKNGAGAFTVPGMFKVKTRIKPATRARKGTNPFTGEEMMFKAKPKSTVVKVLPLKAVKDMV